MFMYHARGSRVWPRLGFGDVDEVVGTLGIHHASRGFRGLVSRGKRAAAIRGLEEYYKQCWRATRFFGPIPSLSSTCLRCGMFRAVRKTVGRSDTRASLGAAVGPPLFSTRESATRGRPDAIGHTLHQKPKGGQAAKESMCSAASACISSCRLISRTNEDNAKACSAARGVWGSPWTG
jgi:hypothetical protein